MCRWSRLAFCLIQTCLSSGISFGSHQDAESTYLEVRLVQIEVRVTGKDDHPVANLTRDDLILKEEGQIQKIRYLDFVEGPSAEVRPPTPTAPSTPETGEQSLPPSPTWIYILPEFGNPNQLSRTFKPLQLFIAEHLQPGFKISLAGLPFSDRKDFLLAALDRLMRGPYGDGEGNPGTINPYLSHLDDLEFERIIAEETTQTSQLLPLAGFGRETVLAGRLNEVSPVSLERIDRLVPLFGQLALLRYQELISRMSGLPGKKVIVLFRPGLQLDKDNTGFLNRVASLALRHRVSFYTIDPQGLDPGVEIEDRRTPLAWGGRRRRLNRTITSDQLRAAETRAGLETLAKETGGKAISQTNDLGEVLEAVVEDSFNYYVLGYYPQDLGSKGRFRRIEVKSTRPGVKIQTVRGYYEPKRLDELSRQEKQLALYQAVTSGTSQPLQVDANLELFADEHLQPVVIYSAGVRTSDLTPEQKKSKISLRVAVLSRLGPASGVGVPDFQEQHLEQQLPAGQWRTLRDDHNSLVTLNSWFEVSAGDYFWRIVFQDEESGKLGIHDQVFSIPSFREPSTPSSLLLTRQVEPLNRRTSTGKKGSPPEESSDLHVLEAGSFRYMPEPHHIFHRGEPIYLLYDLYQPTAEDIESVSRGIQLGLLKGRTPVAGVKANGEAHIDPGARIIRFTAFIDTSSLEPGEYTVLAILPHYQTRKVPHLEENFTLLSKDTKVALSNRLSP